jgi:hypothetical protein
LASSWAVAALSLPSATVPMRSLAGTDSSRRYLRRKLKCDNTTFQDLCSELVIKIAERNYQIEVLNMQVLFSPSS